MQRIVFIVLLGLLPLRAAADGKVYPPTAFPVEVTIPDQRALIHFTNGVERLVIETRFTGAGTNFAWVVPLPSQPVVEAASTGLFPTLQYYFQSPVTHNVTRYYLGILGSLVVLLLIRWQVVRSGGSLIPVLFLLLVLLLVAALLLPALSKAGSKSTGMTESSSPSVSILDRQLVGVFETTTISSHDPQALQTWLRQNGFVVTTNSEPVIADYVKDGWVFVATKVRRDHVENQTSTPHPLSFTFKTDRPVYPMRLTGVDNGPLEVELYVFGDQRAYAQHFKVERCTKPTYNNPPNGYAYRSPEALNIAHPLLREWVGGSEVATKLTATLLADQMRHDVWLEGQGFWETRNRKFSHAGAATFALNWAACVLAIGLVVAYAIGIASHSSKPDVSTPVLYAITVSFAIGGLIYLMLPKIPVRLEKVSFGETRNAQWSLMTLLEGESLAKARGITSDLTNQLRNASWDRFSRTGHWPNHYLGGQIREEDSPGNFTLREQDSYIEFVVYDTQGAESVLATWAKPEK